ncbi:hypothetical protein COOONC_19987 [Cooperia oncophora]
MLELRNARATVFIQTVVDYLTKKHEAKTAAEIPDAEREKNRIFFEEQVVRAKLARGRHRLHGEDDENDAMMRKSKARRRRSLEDVDSIREMKSTGVNTVSVRRASSAEALTKAFPKSTSTSDLTGPFDDDESIERFVREELRKMVEAREKEKPASTFGKNV